MTNKERFMLWLLAGCLICTIGIAVAAMLSGCSPAKAAGVVTVQEISGPGGRSCFVFYLNSDPFAANCP